MTTHVSDGPSEQTHASYQAGPCDAAATRLRDQRISRQAKSDFPFFNISHPSETRSRQHRKQVRSHVTHQQHQRRKGRVFTTTTTTTTTNQTFQPYAAKVEASLPERRRKSQTPLLSANGGVEPRQHQRITRPSSISRTSTSISSKSSTSISQSSTDPQESNFDTETSQRLEILQAISRHTVPHPSSQTIARNDPFTNYQIEWQPWYGRLLHYMMTVFAPRAWPSLKITNEQGTDWENFMTLKALAEPALLYVRLLFASGDLVRVGILDRQRSYSLQLHAIQAINEALSDPQRCISDGLILAVGRIALHEFMYGDRAAANKIHRPAQRRMIDLRGGIMNLGFPDLVKRLMRWADRVMSIQGNTERLLPDEEDLNNETYGTQQSLTVLEAWAPETGQALRERLGKSSQGVEATG